MNSEMAQRAESRFKLSNLLTEPMLEIGWKATKVILLAVGWVVWAFRCQGENNQLEVRVQLASTDQYLVMYRRHRVLLTHSPLFWKILLHPLTSVYTMWLWCVVASSKTWQTPLARIPQRLCRFERLSHSPGMGQHFRLKTPRKVSEQCYEDVLLRDCLCLE